MSTEPGIPEKRGTWAELFFDLVFAFALTEVSALLLQDCSPAGVGRALVVFVPIYWAWVGTSVHANLHDVDNLVGRIGILAVGLCSMFMALAVPGAYGERGVYFGAAYLALRTVLGVLVFRGERTAIAPFSVAVFVTGPLMRVGGLLDGPARLVLWLAAAAVDLATPLLTRRRLTVIRFHSEHLPERFGLFLIIAWGESIVAAGVPAAAQQDLSPVSMVSVAVAFVVACSLWWGVLRVRRGRDAPAAGDHGRADRRHPAAAVLRPPRVDRGDPGRRGRARGRGVAPGPGAAGRGRGTAPRGLRPVPGDLRLHPVPDDPRPVSRPVGGRSAGPGAAAGGEVGARGAGRACCCWCWCR